MTLTQLEAFVLVARLGSVKAAAEALGVSEPAVSGALSALRQHLGDQLLTRTPAGMSLTPGGERLVPIASQMVNLAADAHDAIRQAQGAPAQLRVATTSTFAELVAPQLVDAFVARGLAVEPSLGTAAAREMPALLLERLADVVIGPRLAGEAAAGIDSEPLMRYRLEVVGSPRHRLAGKQQIPWPLLADEPWLVDPSGHDPSTEVGMLLERLHVPPAQVRVFPSLTGAWAAAAEGEGVAPAISHVVAREIEREALVRLDVVGTPVQLLWHVSTLGTGRRSPATDSFRRWLTTAEAMQSMHRVGGGVPATRFRPPVYVTLWS